MSLHGPAMPTHYAAWRKRLTAHGGPALTPAYVQQRLAALGETDGEEARRFRKRYGDAHWRRILGWLEQAGRELAVAAPSKQ